MLSYQLSRKYLLTEIRPCISSPSCKPHHHKPSQPRARNRQSRNCKLLYLCFPTAGAGKTRSQNTLARGSFSARKNKHYALSAANLTQQNENHARPNPTQSNRESQQRKNISRNHARFHRAESWPSNLLPDFHSQQFSKRLRGRRQHRPLTHSLNKPKQTKQ